MTDKYRQSNLIAVFDEKDIGKDFFQRRSPLIKDSKIIRNINDLDRLILVHHTTDTFLDSILKEGLLTPSNTKKGYDDFVPSDCNAVYLSSIVDNYYLSRATETYGGEGIYVVVQVPKGNLLPDSEGFSKVSLENSIVGTGCKHIGNISINNIRSIYNSSGNLIYDASN